ncbi:hypothetical protein [Candidatus Electronema sp. JM]|uniref:hypothetical protein n=1 Tax=Candidatus Electronema sp. JM TaxID=3401571 RepID=UPI003AA7F6F4
MQLKNSTLFAIAASLAVVALAFGYFSFQLFSPQEELLPAAPESATARQQPAASSAQQYHPVAADNADSSPAETPANKTVKEQQPVAPEHNPPPEIAEQPSPKPCADSACAERVLSFLNDPANDEAAKVKMAQTWLKPETAEETLSLLHVLKEANETQQHDLADRLRQMLAGADSSESAELLLKILKGEEPNFSLQELPEDLQYEIKKAIRLNPDKRIGEWLADAFSLPQQSEEVLAAVQDVKHPEMVYELLAKESDQEKIREQVQSLQSYSDPKTLDVIMRLGDEKILSAEDAAQAAYNWADANGDTFNAEHCAAYLSESERSPAQRAIAAAALAAASDPAQAMAALQKAYDAEVDQNLRLSYAEALERVRRRREPVRTAE